MVSCFAKGLFDKVALKVTYIHTLINQTMEMTYGHDTYWSWLRMQICQTKIAESSAKDKTQHSQWVTGAMKKTKTLYWVELNMHPSSLICTYIFLLNVFLLRTPQKSNNFQWAAKVRIYKKRSSCTITLLSSMKWVCHYMREKRPFRMFL